MVWNLSIFCIDGVTTYGCISDDKVTLREFLLDYDHEGSSISLVKHDGNIITDIDDLEKVYQELNDN